MTLGAIPRVEAATGLPVLSSNLCISWHMAKVLQMQSFSSADLFNHSVGTFFLLYSVSTNFHLVLIELSAKEEEIRTDGKSNLK